MKVNPILIKILVILNLIFLITIPINLTLIRIAHIPETESIRLSAPYDWISIWSRMDDKDDVAVDVAIDSNDDIVIGGYTMNTSVDQFVAKFDETGTQLWNDTRDGGSQDWFRALAVSGTDIYVGIDFYNQSLPGYESFLGKYDGLGNYQWNKSWIKSGASGAYTRDMTLSQTGDFYFIGEMAYGSHPSYTYQYFILKLDSSGAEVWNVTFGIKDETRKSINGVTTFDDLVYIVGQEYNQSRTENDPLIACFNATNGYQKWNMTWDMLAYNDGRAMDVIVDSSGNIYVTGYYGMMYNKVLFLRKYNPSRTLLWERTYQDISSYGQGIALEYNSNIYIAGATKEDFSESSALLIKFATNGTLLGVGSWQGNTTVSYNTGYNVDVDSSGNVYMVGYTPGISGRDAFIIKNLELSLPSNGGTPGIPSFNLWIVIGILGCAILLITRKKRLINH